MSDYQAPNAPKEPKPEAPRSASAQCDHDLEVACVECADRISVETPLEVRDGDWVVPEPQVGFKWGCCDCGLFHSVDFRVTDGQVELRVYRDKAKTDEWRRTRTHDFVPADQLTLLSLSLREERENTSRMFGQMVEQGLRADAAEKEIEQMDRSRQMREENVRRHEQERDADLADVRATNEHLMRQMESMLEKQARMVERYEQVTSERPRVGLDAVSSGRSGPNPATTKPVLPPPEAP